MLSLKNKFLLTALLFASFSTSFAAPTINLQILRDPNDVCLFGEVLIYYDTNLDGVWDHQINISCDGIANKPVPIEQTGAIPKNSNNFYGVVTAGSIDSGVYEIDMKDCETDFIIGKAECSGAGCKPKVRFY